MGPWAITLADGAKEGLKALVQKSRECIKGMLGQTAETLTLNPMLRGWANYHRCVCSAGALWTADRIIHHQLLCWARRTHPNKSYGWLNRKYFGLADRHGFATRIRNRSGESAVLRLYSLPQTVLEWHIKVKGEANPYDPVYTEYFERRRCFAWHALPREKTGQLALADV